jgi:C4-dicarboxylate transporter DctM subunit
MSHDGAALAGWLPTLSRRLNRASSALSSVMLVSVVATNAAEIILRSAFNYSLDWIFEINLLFATWLYFLGICQVYYRRGDISVDVFVRILPAQAKFVWVWVVDLATLGTLAVIGWYGVRLVILQWPFKTPGGLALPTATYTAPLVIGAIIMIVHVCAQRLAEQPHDGGHG